jgi:acetoin utilization protein AcuC
MSGAATVVFDPRLTSYDFGRGHPLAPVRIDLTMRLAASLGVLELPNVTVVGASEATQDQLEFVHTPFYIEAVKALSGEAGGADPAHGLGTDDNPTFVGMHSAAASVVGASVEAARRVWAGESRHAVNLSGGLHHAMADAASGFCIYNDPAIAIAWLLQQGADRIAYVDIDVHHGDGVQAAFFDDPRVLTISLHETPRTLFPGTGTATETGGPQAPGFAVNVAMPPGTSDGEWLRAFHAVVPPLLREFRPELLVSQHGCDTHRDDPLAHLMLTVDGQRAAHLALHALAHELCEGRWVALGGGGYAVVDVVPRTWTHLLAVVAGDPIEPSTPTPSNWQRYVANSTGRQAPTRMSDGAAPRFRDWSNGYDPDSWLDRSIQATRVAVFPLHGLDPAH